MLSSDLMPRLFDMARECGRIASGLTERIHPSFKPDHSVVTEADREIAVFLRGALADLIQSGEHALLTEEDPDVFERMNAAFLESARYLWVVDPVDGTRVYANGMPGYGISIGVLKDRRPWLGMVYMPALQELFYCDGQDAYFVREPFTDGEARRRIVPVEYPVTRQSIFFVGDTFFRKHEWDLSVCSLMLPACAVIDLCWPAIGRAAGCYFKAHVWDFAGSWPIFRAAGLDLRSLQTGRPLEDIREDVFMGTGMDTWRLKERFLLSSAGNFEVLRKAVRPKRPA